MNTHITDGDRIAMCKACTIAEAMKICKLCAFQIGLVKPENNTMIKILKTFLHGETFVTLLLCDGVYTVNLYTDQITGKISATFSGSSEAALEIYNQTCDTCVKLTEN